jgi:tetratricopeptide (TPR) repeat protein
MIAVVLGLLAQVCVAQNTPKVALDTSETMFAVLTAINACGYDQDLASSDTLRQTIRAEVKKAIQESAEAKAASGPMCEFYHDHQPADSSRDLAQYVSLALYLGDPPAFMPKGKEAELPPDASVIVGFAPLISKFYEAAGLAAIWQKHKAEYVALPDQYHEPLAKMLFDTEIYLKIPSSAYLGRQFTVYLDPMGAPGQTNARNYGSDYYVVISPTGRSLKMQQIRHTYLHYLLDPLALKSGASFKRLEPLLEPVKSAPMDDSFKNNISLLVTECLVRAIEARTNGTKATPEADRLKEVDASVNEGYILTRHFYEALLQFEKDPTGMRNAYPDLLSAIDVGKEMKRAAQVQFASQATPELLKLSRPSDQLLLKQAEKRLAAGDPEGAQKLAQQALDENREDPGRALFILAQVATMNRDMQGARGYFERALGVAKEPKVLAWSHIYLGRISDLQEDRDAALVHYRAALDTGGSMPEVKAAAQRGIDQPYEPPTKSQ